MSHSSRQCDRPSRWWTLARFGQSAWFFANLYEGLVGVPELLVDAQPRRRAGLLAAGSPVRYFAPVAPLALVPSGVVLVEQWQMGADRRLLGAAGAGFGTALAASGYLIRTVNVPLLAGGEPQADQRELPHRWHRTNVVRLAALGGAMVSLSAAQRRRRGIRMQS